MEELGIFTLMQHISKNVKHQDFIFKVSMKL